MRKLTLKKRIIKKGVVILIIALFLITGLFSLAAYADTVDTRSILNQFNFESNDSAKSTIRQIAWSIALGLHWMVGGLEEVIYSVNDTLGGFFTSSGVQALEEKMIPLALELVAVLILFIGVMSMIKPQQATTIISNMIVGITIAIALPTLLSTAYSFTNQAITYINSDSSGTLQKISDQILLDNVTDVTRYDQEDFKSTTLKYKNYYIMPGADGTKITKIDPTELVNPENMKHPDVWRNIVKSDQDGKETLEELWDGSVGFVTMPALSQYYYRWQFDWLNIYSTLLVTGFALIMSGIKIARLLYELAINQTMTQMFALLDVMTGQRLKKCIQSLIATFGTLFAVFFMLQMYIIGMTYITNVSNIFLRLLLMVALAFAVIDGPNLFEQVFGVDAGIHSALRTMYGLKAAGGIMAGGVAAIGGRGALEALKAKGLIGSTRSAIGKAGEIVGGLGGAVAGAVSGHNETTQRVNSVKQGFNAVSTAAAGVAGATNVGASGGDSTTVKSPFKKPINSAPAAGNAPQSSYGSVPTADYSSSDAESSHVANNNSYSPPMADSAEKPLNQESTQSSSESSPSVKEQASNNPQTIGNYLRSSITGKMEKSSAVISARRAYSLTKSSAQARGNKKVDREVRAQIKMQGNESLSHRKAIKEVKTEDRNAKVQSMLYQGEIKK